MATLSDLRTRREALLAARASGEARVSCDGRTVEYRSLAEIAAAEGRRIVGHRRVTTAKGL